MTFIQQSQQPCHPVDINALPGALEGPILSTVLQHLFIDLTDGTVRKVSTVLGDINLYFVIITNELSIPLQKYLYESRIWQNKKSLIWVLYMQIVHLACANVHFS